MELKERNIQIMYPNGKEPQLDGQLHDVTVTDFFEGTANGRTLYWINYRDNSQKDPSKRNGWWTPLINIEGQWYKYHITTKDPEYIDYVAAMRSRKFPAQTRYLEELPALIPSATLARGRKLPVFHRDLFPITNRSDNTYVRTLKPGCMIVNGNSEHNQAHFETADLLSEELNYIMHNIKNPNTSNFQVEVERPRTTSRNLILADGRMVTVLAVMNPCILDDTVYPAVPFDRETCRHISHSDRLIVPTNSTSIKPHDMYNVLLNASRNVSNLRIETDVYPYRENKHGSVNLDKKPISVNSRNLETLVNSVRSRQETKRGYEEQLAIIRRMNSRINDRNKNK